MKSITLLLTCYVACSVVACAKPVLTATCEEPKGQRYDFEKGKVLSLEDGFSGVHPVFILDDSKPGKLIVVWGHAKALGDAVPPEAKDVDIVCKSENQITAVEVGKNGEAVMVFTLFPKAGIVYFTQHRYQAYFGGVPSSGTYYAKAVFSFTE